MAQLAIAVAGAGVGSLFGAPQLGFAIGSAIGGALLAPDLPDVHGPKIEDGRVTSSAYGGMIPIVWGTVPVAGNIIDASDLVTESSESSSGGKGGPKQTTVSYQQYVDYDVALCEGVVDVIKIYANEQIIYDNSPGTSVTKPEWLQFVFYSGDETQLPDSTFEALHTDVPAYRGVAHIVFKRFLVSEFRTTAINFRFIVTKNYSINNTAVDLDQGENCSGIGSNYVFDLYHNRQVDLMIASLYRQHGDCEETIAVAYDPYTQNKVWSLKTNSNATYALHSWVDSFAIPRLLNGIPVHQPNEYTSIYLRYNSFFPTIRMMQIVDSLTGAYIARIQIKNSESLPMLSSLYEDDAFFIQVVEPAFGDPSAYLLSIDSLFGVSDFNITLPDGYRITDNIHPIYIRKGNRFAGTSPSILFTFENTTTGVYAYSIVNDVPLGVSASSWLPNYSAVTELPAGSTTPRQALWDDIQGVWWLYETGTTNLVRFHKISEAGSLLATYDWGALFSITGATSSRKPITYDFTTGYLWTVIAGAAYRWPTWDTSQTPEGFGSAIEASPLAMNAYTGHLWTGDINDHFIHVYKLAAIDGGTQTLQSIVEDLTHGN